MQRFGNTPSNGPPLKEQGLPVMCRRKPLPFLDLRRRRAGDSNPQPASRHLISSQSGENPKQGHGNDLGQSGGDVSADWSAVPAENVLAEALADADLRMVVERWGDLPEAVRAGILAMVRAAGEAS